MFKIYMGPLPENPEYCKTDYELLISCASHSTKQGKKWIIAFVETKPNQPSIVPKRSLIRRDIESKYAHYFRDPLENEQHWFLVRARESGLPYWVEKWSGEQVTSQEFLDLTGETITSWLNYGAESSGSTEQDFRLNSNDIESLSKQFQDLAAATYTLTNQLVLDHEVLAPERKELLAINDRLKEMAYKVLAANER